MESRRIGRSAPSPCNSAGEVVVDDGGKIGTPRQSRRFGVQLPALYVVRGRQRAGTVLNVSVHGCAMATDQLPTAETYLSLEIDVTDGVPPIEVDLAAVRWVSSHRCGIEFIRMAPNASARLKNFVSLLEATS